jgi:hypothetical protein
MNNYITPFNPSLWQESSKLSCKNMTDLAINELNRNSFYNNAIFNNLLCEYSHKFTDRDLELNMQKGSHINKKSCINKRPEYNKGSWEQNFAIYNPITGYYSCDNININFIENTKSKMNDYVPCSYNNINDINDNKKLTTQFNQDYFDTWDKFKNNSVSTIDRYNNHNPVIGDDFSQPATINKPQPEPINDPTYKSIKPNINYPIRYPKGYSDCSTLYNYNRYNDNKNNLDIYLEPCSNP